MTNMKTHLFAIVLLLIVTNGLADSMCPRGLILDASIPGTITSPGFETGTYPPSQNCEYVLRPQGKKLILTFTVFSLDDHYNCIFDSLTILRRIDGLVHEIAKYCGSKLPNELIVEGDEILVHFISDAYDQRQGFRLDYRAMKGTQGYMHSSYADYERVYNAHQSTRTGCGKRQWTESYIDANIRGGKPVESAKKWPWTVYIHDGRRFCGGSILNDKWILTAAHCVLNAKPTDDTFVALLGITDIRNPANTWDVAEIIIHPESEGTRNADIALLRLKTALSMSDEIRPICFTDFYPDSSMQCYSIGWGRKARDGPFPNVLHEVKIPLWDNSDCRKRLKTRIKPTMMCAGDTNANACLQRPTPVEMYGSSFEEAHCYDKFLELTFSPDLKRKTYIQSADKMVGSFYVSAEATTDLLQGDSGGPLMCFDRNRSQWTVVGITSFGKHCDSPSGITVFTKVAPYIDWIQKTINNAS